MFQDHILDFSNFNQCDYDTEASQSHMHNISNNAYKNDHQRFMNNIQNDSSIAVESMSTTSSSKNIQIIAQNEYLNSYGGNSYHKFEDNQHDISENQQPIKTSQNLFGKKKVGIYFEEKEQQLSISQQRQSFQDKDHQNVEFLSSNINYSTETIYSEKQTENVQYIIEDIPQNQHYCFSQDEQYEEKSFKQEDQPSFQETCQQQQFCDNANNYQNLNQFPYNSNYSQQGFQKDDYNSDYVFSSNYQQHGQNELFQEIEQPISNQNQQDFNQSLSNQQNQLNIYDQNLLNEQLPPIESDALISYQYQVSQQFFQEENNEQQTDENKEGNSIYQKRRFFKNDHKNSEYMFSSNYQQNGQNQQDELFQEIQQPNSNQNQQDFNQSLSNQQNQLNIYDQNQLNEQLPLIESDALISYQYQVSQQNFQEQNNQQQRNSNYQKRNACKVCIKYYKKLCGLYNHVKSIHESSNVQAFSMEPAQKRGRPKNNSKQN
ncbi:hypothetical protein ABPG72_021045 [Tetrahymena utriculariae]